MALTLRFPQYKELRLAAGFGYTHQIRDTPTVHSVLEGLGAPAGTIEEIIERACGMTCRASKSKPMVKDEEDILSGLLPDDLLVFRGLW